MKYQVKTLLAAGLSFVFLNNESEASTLTGIYDFTATGGGTYGSVDQILGSFGFTYVYDSANPSALLFAPDFVDLTIGSKSYTTADTIFDVGFAEYGGAHKVPTIRFGGADEYGTGIGSISSGTDDFILVFALQPDGTIYPTTDPYSNTPFLNYTLASARSSIFGAIITHLSCEEGSCASYVPSPSPIPLPGALSLLVSGLSAMGFFGWRRKWKLTASANSLGSA